MTGGKAGRPLSEASPPPPLSPAICTSFALLIASALFFGHLLAAVAGAVACGDGGGHCRGLNDTTATCVGRRFGWA